MPKFNFLKKNREPHLSTLHERSFSPEKVWIWIVGIGITGFIIIALLSALTSLSVINHDPFSRKSDNQNINSTTSINKERLLRAVDIIRSRIE